jgi:hypothetical protein
VVDKLLEEVVVLGGQMTAQEEPEAPVRMPEEAVGQELQLGILEEDPSSVEVVELEVLHNLPSEEAGAGRTDPFRWQGSVGLGAK